MKNFCATVTTIAALLIVGIAAPVHADQNDNRLDTLFGRLHQTESFVEATKIVQQIWVVWTEFEEEDTHEAMLRGVDAMAGADYDAALAIFDEVIRMHPAFAEAWNKRATVYYLMGRLEESLNDVAVTLDLEPRHFGALSGKGMIMMAQGNFTQAIEAFERALETNPHMPGVRMRIEKLQEELDKNAI